LRHRPTHAEKHLASHPAETLENRPDKPPNSTHKNSEPYSYGAKQWRRNLGKEFPEKNCGGVNYPPSRGKNSICERSYRNEYRNV
jgi:hypothetical protein